MKGSLVRRLLPLATLLLLLGGFALPAASPARAADFADSAFLRTWLRTDDPVAARQVTRSWYWGPGPRCSVREPYLEAPDGSGAHLVQYFDKSRMEINNPAGDPTSPWYVTNGLLAYELVAGLVQTGNSSYQVRSPADIPLASDLGDENAPTYHSFQRVTSTPAGMHVSTSALGQPATLTIDHAGTVGNDGSKAAVAGTTVAYYDATTQHNVPSIFWNFINQSGPVLVGGQLVTGRLSDPPLFVTGLPLSEAYWARVRVGGQPTDVLIQVFQRRVLTYLPALRAPWNVQMGNVGAHYLLWRYGAAPCNPTPPPPPQATPVPPTPTPQPPATATPRPLPAVIPLYRLYNPQTGEHLYTVDPVERAQLIARPGAYRDEKTEGRVWSQQVAGTVPFYRLYNNLPGPTARHLYTTVVVERNALLAAGWVIEIAPDGGPGGGYVYKASLPTTTPLYRWSSTAINDHIFTINPASLVPYGYSPEGIACYVIKP